jgi:hypothetical protein
MGSVILRGDSCGCARLKVLGIMNLLLYGYVYVFVIHT